MAGASDYLHFAGQSGDNFVIPSIIQFLSLLNKSGSLTFALSEEAKADMYMYEGNLMHTELNKLGGIDVISHMFCWGYGHGKFEFRSDYKGEKLLYKSLGNLVPQQILMRIMQRNDECPYKKDLQEKFTSITTPITIDQSKVFYEDTVDPIRGKMIERLNKSDTVILSDLLTDIYAGEMDSCRAFHELLGKGTIINAAKWDEPLAQKNLLDVMNIISKFTDQSIALKFLADKKAMFGLNTNEVITVRKLKKLANAAKENFTELLPQATSRWQDMHTSINEYLDKLSV